MNTHIFKKQSKSHLTILFLFFISLVLIADFPQGNIAAIFFVEEAEAVIGRPASPGSVAGVHRRTRRRVHRRHHIAYGTRVYSLPGDCVLVSTGGVTYYRCSNVYYRPYYEGNTVVYVVVENP